MVGTVTDLVDGTTVLDSAGNVIGSCAGWAVPRHMLRTLREQRD